MSTPHRVVGSEYIAWAKTRSQARFNLAGSGVSPYPIRELEVTLEDIELTGPSWYGYEPLQRALAEKYGVAADCVVAAIGCSQANHLAMAALLEPGDEVVMEHPVYEPLLAMAHYLGAEVKPFERRPAAFRIDLEEVRRKVTARTRLIVITNLHNPTGALADEETLKELGEVARRVGARVLVDEVYLEMLWVQGDRSSSATRSAFHLGSEFIATSSLTKAYGLNGLRCGWILTEPELVRRMWRLYDLFVSIPAHPAERLSVIALARLEQIADRAKALLARNHALLGRFLDSRDDLEVLRPDFGTVMFPRWLGGHVEPLCTLLREKYETTVVPGRFFGMPDHFRIGIGDETEALKAGLERLAAALDELM